MATLSSILGASYTGETGAQGATGNTGATGAAGPVGPKSITIKNPVSAENVTLFYTTQQMVLSNATAIITGSSFPLIRYYIHSGSDRNTVATTHVSASVVETSIVSSTISTAIIPANRWVWLTTDETSGTVTSLTVNLLFS